MAQVKPNAEASAGTLREQVDPELVALDAPPKGRRLLTMTVMALTVVASIGLIGALRTDIAYFFAPATATDVGEVTALDPASLEPNTFVRVAGTPSGANTVRYTKLLGATTYAVFPLAGQRDVFVHVPVTDAESERNLARREYSGRLVTFGQLGGRFGEVREYLGETMGVPVSSESFLILADEPPGSYGWALLLAALAALFVVINVFLMLRWFRPLPVSESA